MLRNVNTYSYDRDYTTAFERMVFAHILDLKTKTESVEKNELEEAMEYVFQLIRSAFLYVDAFEDNFPPFEKDGISVYNLFFYVLSFPFKDDADKAQVEQWNELLYNVSRDFMERRDNALRGKCDHEQLDSLLKDWVWYFDPEDRVRLNIEKLKNLITFVYDYCMLTMREAKLHPNLDLHISGKVQIREKEYHPPFRICASIKKYEPFIKEPIEGGEYPFVNQVLPQVKLANVVQNPHASDSNCAAMFVDMMHKFFLSFGLHKRGSATWTKGEKMFIYELLRLFGLCNSKQSASKSTYVSTVINEYGSYFSSCNLRSWIRANQAYSYLMFCSVDELVRMGQAINEPFLSLDSYSVAEARRQEEHKPIKPLTWEELPEDIKTAITELSSNKKPGEKTGTDGTGKEFMVTHTEYSLVNYGTVIGKNYVTEGEVEWDSRLDYIMQLIKSDFEYITFFPLVGKSLLVRNDIHDPLILSRLISLLDRDYLGRLESIPRGSLDSDKAKSSIAGFQGRMRNQEDNDRFDGDKFYHLFLFIYDYVCLTYKEAAISPYLKQFLPSSIQIGKEQTPSTLLADEMIMWYLENLIYEYDIDADGSSAYQKLGKLQMYVPNPESSYTIKLPSDNVKNMTAMFYDLFVRFFRTFKLSKRSDVKYLSDQENILVTELANCCGICATGNPNSVRTMFLTNKDYFQNSSLELVIRENEYGYLLLNTMSDVLFEPKTEVEQQDS